MKDSGIEFYCDAQGEPVSSDGYYSNELKM